METISYTDLRRSLADAMDQVNEEHTPLLVTRQRDKSVVMLSAADYSAIEETLHLMSSANNASRLTKAIDELRRGGGKVRDLIE